MARRKKRGSENVVVSEPFIKRVDENLLKIHYKLAELNNNINELKRQLECMTSMLNKILDKTDTIERQHGAIIAKLEETIIDKIKRLLKKARQGNVEKEETNKIK